MKSGILIGVIAGFFILASCSKDDEPSYFENNFIFEFNNGPHDWTGDFADYPVTDSVFYELQFAHTTLPSPLNTATKALMISGNNHSDDLFMFIKRKFTGLRPNTTYELIVEMDIASKAPTNAIGVGGSPGESVVLKVGGSKTEPKKIVQDSFYSMNIDKGNQSQSGTDMKLIGNVGVSDTTTVFTMIKRNSFNAPFEVTTDSEGSAWVIIGSESGFEATTTLYFKRIVVTFR